MSADATPESFALALDDARALVGLTAAEIRARLESADVALVEARRGAPPGWPAELVERDPAHDGGTRWSYQRASGEWRPFLELPRAPAAAASGPAFLYTRRPAASPFARVRPVAFLLFDALGLCSEAKATWVDGALRLAEDRTLPDLDERKAVRRLEPRSPGGELAIEKLQRLLGLSPPLALIEARDFGADVTGSLAIGYGVDPTGAGIGILDADQRMRLAIRIGPDGEWLVNVHEDRGQWRAEPIGPAGLRVAIFDRGGRERRYLDVHAGLAELFFVEAGGPGRAVRLFLAHHATPGLPPGLETDDVNVAAILSAPIPRPRIGGVPAFPRLQAKRTGSGEEGESLLAFMQEETRVDCVMPAYFHADPAAALLLARGTGAAILAAP